ncbi:phage distal tail protein domain-containing protein [Lactococcus laudensis]|uniref:phage distal tail protein domain-containing protein n=1 Tax=Pseudolactococcus laudensis TaxID=1494461 RepID=UPI002FC98F0D
MVRTYKIHTNLDGNDNEIIDLTNGKIRLYQPSDLGIVTNTNIWSSQGLGVFGDTAISHPSMDFKLETFGSSLQENYKLINEFVSKILAQKYVTIEYTSEQGTFYADVKLAKVSKTEGYGQNGTFSETISFDVINKWYVYEALTFSKFKNADFSDKTKIYTNSRYTYANDSYVYTTEDNIDRFSKWKIEENVFSFVARLTPSNSNEKKYGVRFLDEQANEYTSIIFNMTNKPDYVQLNTDVNDEYYQASTSDTIVNMFSALDFQKFRTRIFRKGTMELVNLDTVEMNIKRKVDFV